MKRNSGKSIQKALLCFAPSLSSLRSFAFLYSRGSEALLAPLASVAVGMAVTSRRPHRPVLAALPHTVLTLDMPPHGGWRGNARLEMHEQLWERLASDRSRSPGCWTHSHSMVPGGLLVTS